MPPPEFFFCLVRHTVFCYVISIFFFVRQADPDGRRNPKSENLVFGFSFLKSRARWRENIQNPKILFSCNFVVSRARWKSKNKKQFRYRFLSLKRAAHEPKLRHMKIRVFFFVFCFLFLYFFFSRTRWETKSEIRKRDFRRFFCFFQFLVPDGRKKYEIRKSRFRIS